MPSWQHRWPGWLVVSALVVGADQATKAWIASALAVNESLGVAPFFDLVRVYNSGAAFSFLAGAGGWQRWFFVVLALSVSVWIVTMLRQYARDRLLSAALSLILGGALGNMIDRLNQGAVLDFLDVHYAGHHFPAFNVADSAISVGVALMLWHSLSSRKS